MRSIILLFALALSCNLHAQTIFTQTAVLNFGVPSNIALGSDGTVFVSHAGMDSWPGGGEGGMSVYSFDGSSIIGTAFIDQGFSDLAQYQDNTLFVVNGLYLVAYAYDGSLYVVKVIRTDMLRT